MPRYARHFPGRFPEAPKVEGSASRVLFDSEPANRLRFACVRFHLTFIKLAFKPRRPADVKMLNAKQCIWPQTCS